MFVLSRFVSADLRRPPLVKQRVCWADLAATLDLFEEKMIEMEMKGNETSGGSKQKSL